jgi:hypothetical protein
MLECTCECSTAVFAVERKATTVSEMKAKENIHLLLKVKVPRNSEMIGD